MAEEEAKKKPGPCRGTHQRQDRELVPVQPELTQVGQRSQGVWLQHKRTGTESGPAMARSCSRRP